jgi:hypothetical protein
MNAAAVVARLPLPPASSRLARGLFAAAVLEAIGLGLMGAKFRHTTPVALYRTLGQESAPAAAGTIRVVPDASLSLTDWNALLHVLGLRVVGGPDAAGAYIVVPMNAAATRHALQQLRAIRGIRLAQPVAVTP